MAKNIRTKKLILFIWVLFSDLGLAQALAENPIAKIKIQSQLINVEVAETPEARAKGLMFRKELKSDEGMLFVFENSQPLNFWMRNTLIPLSIGYFDENQKLLNVLEMVPASDLDQNPTHYSSAGLAKYALEMNKGWFTQHKIVVGDKFEIHSIGKSKLLKLLKTKARPKS